MRLSNVFRNNKPTTKHTAIHQHKNGRCMADLKGCLPLHRIKSIHHPQSHPEGRTQGKQENGQESVP